MGEHSQIPVALFEQQMLVGGGVAGPCRCDLHCVASCVVNVGSRLCEAHAASAQGREVGSEKGKNYRVRDN